MPGPARIYDVNPKQLPPYVELVARLERVVKPRAARVIAGWVELERQGVPQDVPRNTERRYRKAVTAAMGTPVPPRPGKAYEGQAEPIQAGQVGSTTVVATGSMAVVALVVLAVVSGVGAGGVVPLATVALLSRTYRAHIMGGGGGSAGSGAAQDVGRRLLLLRP